VTSAVSEPTGRPNPSAALSWSFGAFRKHTTAFLGLAAVVTVLQFLQLVAAQPLQNITADCLDPQTGGQQQACQESISGAVTPVLVAVLFWLLALLATIGVQRAALRTTRGLVPAFTDLLSTASIVRYVLFVLAYVALVALGLLLCVLPGLLAAYLLQLGPYYVLDRGAGVREAISSSASAVRANAGPALVLLMVNALALLLGGLFYGLPTLVTLPIASLFTAHLYRQFNSEPVA
jgi:uncharacterized membrane protein